MATVIADKIGGTQDKFVAMMNNYARSLGAKDSHFANPTGLPNAQNLTSAYDMALITRKAYQTPALMKYFGARTYTMPATNKRAKAQAYVTLHKMMKKTRYYYDGVVAGKTGWETMSGHTLVTVAQKNGRTIICIVMKSSDAETVYTDTTALLNYGFSVTSGGSGAQYLPVQLAVGRNAAKKSNAAHSDKAPVKTQSAQNTRTIVIMVIGAFAILAVTYLMAARSVHGGRKKRARS